MRTLGTTLIAILITMLSLWSGGCGDDPAAPAVVGSVDIAAYPDSLGAPWTLRGPEGFTISGTTGGLKWVPHAGEYTITWGEVAGWITPVRATQTLAAGESLTFHGFYLPDAGPAGGFVAVAPGSFTMGTPEDDPWNLGNEAQHEVTLTTPFLMAAREVTNAQFVELANWAIARGICAVSGTDLVDDLDTSTAVLLELDHADAEIEAGGGGLVVIAGKDEHPVRAITWHGAAAYCDWLSLRDGLPRAYEHLTWTCNGQRPYAAQGYRLPTEAEWEYACRAGTTTPFSSGEFGGTECDEPALAGVAWYCGTAGGSTHPVGQLAANPWGLHDMHGNAYEWCNDVYSEYDGDATDPVGPVDTSFPYRIFRGGVYDDAALYCRAAYRRSHLAHVAPRITISLRPVRSTGMMAASRGAP